MKVDCLLETAAIDRPACLPIGLCGGGGARSLFVWNSWRPSQRASVEPSDNAWAASRIVAATQISLRLSVRPSVCLPCPGRVIANRRV